MKYSLITSTRVIPADLETPVGIYMKIRDLYPQSALLESSDYHTVQNSISYIGVDPIAQFRVDDGIISYSYPDGSTVSKSIAEGFDIADELQAYIASYDIDRSVESNGFFGYTAYDAVRHFEAVDIRPKEPCFDGVPEMLYVLYRYVIVVNHYKSLMTIIENRPEGSPCGIDELISVIHNNNFAQYGFSTDGVRESPITDEQYKQMVSEGIRHTLRGDVFQIVVSRRFSTAFSGDEFCVYRALRSINPSPYLFYFDFGSFKVFGSSPETHLRVQKGKAYIDPIAGTFRRTGDDARDHELAERLLADAKENAEHIMLVDLARNDLSRCGGKVKIEFLRQIQYYSHVIHMVSRVSAELPADVNIFRLFVNTFPAGTLSGAPKVRAMQLIDEIEPHSRMLYGGCIGFIGFNNELNQAITIRSFVSRGNRLYSQAGAGIVAHSNPESELQEINNKLGALMKAVEYAGNIVKNH
ncbi:MAG: anthranilate synthase component I family protein [Muribaculaceae bacterium]